MKKSKRYHARCAHINRSKLYDMEAAISLLHEMSQPSSFDESVDLAVKLGIDPKKSDQAIRGTITLPHGTGKTVTVVVLATGEAAEAAKAAGADWIGAEDILNKIKEGWLDFDILISSPEIMPELRKLGKILGPKGLMPNPKTGTVTRDTEEAVKSVKSGRIEFRNDRTGCVHSQIGKLSFSIKALKENGEALLNALIKAKPSSLKRSYLLSCSLSSTMGPNINLATHLLARKENL